MKGGYQILDFKNENFTLGTAKNFSGIYDMIERSNKVFLIEDVIIGNVENKPYFVQFYVDSDDFVADFGKYVITVDDDDKVTFTAKTHKYVHRIFAKDDGVNVIYITAFSDSPDEINTNAKLKTFASTHFTNGAMATGNVDDSTYGLCSVIGVKYETSTLNVYYYSPDIPGLNDGFSNIFTTVSDTVIPL